MSISIDSFQTQRAEILKCIRSAMSKADTTPVFQTLDDLFNAYFHRSCTNMLDLRKRNEKNKGELFEVFCYMYLQARGYQPYMLKDCPQDILESLSLSRQDVGIDIVAKVEQTSKKGEPQTLWFAAQCKYRSPTRDAKGRSVHRVTWKDVSTFLSYCTRTGPWIKHIIMTNADSVCWKGHKTQKDYTIARQTFMKLTSVFWSEWLGNGTTNTIATPVKSKEEQTTSSNSRELRLKWLDSLSN